MFILAVLVVTLLLLASAAPNLCATAAAAARLACRTLWQCCKWTASPRENSIVVQEAVPEPELELEPQPER